MAKKLVRVGVGVIIFKNSQVLMGKRVGSHGAHTWNFPGGHLDFAETPYDCAIREVEEEVGVEIANIRSGPWTNDYFESENKHYITLFMLADFVAGQPQLIEPDKCLEWAWFEWNNLPQPRFLPLENLLKTGFAPDLKSKTQL